VSERAEAALGLAPRPLDWRLLGAALAVCAVYYAGAKVGLALTFAPYPISVLWPPNALLLAALLVAPARWWWAMILGAFPAHLLAELQGGVPTAMVLCWFVSNVSEALIGALFVRCTVGSLAGLAALRTVIAFFGAVLVAPLFSSFLDAGFVRLVGWGEVAYWDLWRARFFTNMLATLTFVPVIATWAAADPPQFLRQAGRLRLLEAGTLVAGLLAVSMVTFDSGVPEPTATPSLLYLPLPFLLWAALRFGPPLTSASFAIVAFLVIWGAGHGRGPFLGAVTHDSALPIQLFLISIAVPLLFLAAVIEERRQTERRLRSSQELFATAFRSSPDAIAISHRPDGRIIEVNERWLALLRYPSDTAAPGRIAPLASHVGLLDRPKLFALSGEVGNLRDVDVVLRDTQGGQHQTLISVEAVELEGEPCLVTTVRDMTEQRAAERQAQEQRQQLTHLTRVASLADFSGALAHELNQPLTAILSNAQAAQRFLAHEPPNVYEVRTILSEIVDADKRAGMVIHRLRALMKKGEEEFAPLDLNQLVSEVLDFAHGEFMTLGVAVTATLSRDLPAVTGDRVQLQQLVLNLMTNACEAMQAPGLTEKRLRVKTTHGCDGRVELMVSDTGPGIAADRLERVFESFYTTKDTGLGLGLAICRTIARAHGGSLTAESSPGHGASMRLSLPAT
jgi:signal transduction histidine kinase